MALRTIGEFMAEMGDLAARGPDHMMVSAICLSMCADGEVSDVELLRAREILSDLPGLKGESAEAIEEHMVRAFAAIRADGMDTCMANVARTLKDPKQREEAFTLAALVQYVDHDIDEQENEFLAAFRDVLELPAERADEIVADVEAHLQG